MSKPTVKSSVEMAENNSSSDWPADAMPPSVTYWISECRAMLLRVLCGRAMQEACLRAGLKVRNSGGPVTLAQEHEILGKLNRGDRVRELADQWYAHHLAIDGRRSREDVVCRPGRLAFLASMGLVPRKPEAIR